MIQGESLHIEVFHLKSHVKITLFQTRKHPHLLTDHVKLKKTYFVDENAWVLIKF